MPLLSLTDLFKAETRDEVLATLLAIGASLQLKVTAWQPGQVVRTILTITAQKLADNRVLEVVAAEGGLLDYATEGWLTLLARSLYRIERLLAKAATGDSLSFTNNSGQVQNFAVGELIVAHAVTGKTYRNTAALSIANGATQTGIVLLADEVGTASDAGPGMITTLVSTRVGCTVTNVASVLGADDETDDAIRARCRAKLGALSPNGPKEAYHFVATTPALDDGTVLSGTSVPITRTQPSLNATTGVLTLYLATASGAPTAPDVALVQAAFDKWAEPWGTTSVAAAATEVTVPVTCQIWVQKPNLTEAQIKSKVSAALAAYFKTIPIGGFVIQPDPGKVFVGSLETELAKSLPNTNDGNIIKVAVTLPAADVTMTAGQVAVLGTLTTTVTVVQ
jgi:phage-related baseplate assembly protein